MPAPAFESYSCVVCSSWPFVLTIGPGYGPGSFWNLVDGWHLAVGVEGRVSGSWVAIRLHEKGYPT